MEQTKKSPSSRILSVLGIVAIVILSLALVLNLTLIIKGSTDPKNPPSIFGITPLVVLSGSMSGSNPDSFDEGAMIFVKEVDATELEVGDVITFFDPASKKNSIVTHRIIELTSIETKDSNGEATTELAFITQGDFNPSPDTVAVPASNLIGRYVTHIEKIGNFTLFLDTELGMLLFIGVPVLGFILYEVIRRAMASKKTDSKTAELEAELERLRALQNEQTQKTEDTSSADSNDSTDSSESDASDDSTDSADSSMEATSSEPSPEDSTLEDENKND